MYQETLYISFFKTGAMPNPTKSQKKPKRGYPENSLPTYIFSYPCNRDTHGPYKHPMSKFTCPNVENSENQAIQF